MNNVGEKRNNTYLGRKKGSFPWKRNSMVHKVLAMLLKDKAADDNPFS